MDDLKIFEKIYKKKSAVWTSINPPAQLINIIENGKIKPCKTLDVGCGEGYYSIYLAKKGFDIVGIDFSENAINKAKDNALKNDSKIDFKVLNIRDISLLKYKFDFIFEWALLHHIPPENRYEYIMDLDRILNPGGKYMSVSFNNRNFIFNKSKNKNIYIQLDKEIADDVEIYFSSIDELKELFIKFFTILEDSIIKIPSGKMPFANYLLMEKKHQ